MHDLTKKLIDLNRDCSLEIDSAVNRQIKWNKADSIIRDYLKEVASHIKNYYVWKSPFESVNEILGITSQPEPEKEVDSFTLMKPKQVDFTKFNKVKPNCGVIDPYRCWKPKPKKRPGLTLKYPKEHIIWSGMLARCYKKYDTSYKWYGKKGITVCNRWHEFKNFLDDMGSRPSQKHSIDRIDFKGNYEPTNCRWALLDIQKNNHSGNRKITFGGVTFTVTTWAKRLGLKKETLFYRLNNGWSINKALSVKPHPFNRGYNRPQRKRSKPCQPTKK